MVEQSLETPSTLDDIDTSQLIQEIGDSLLFGENQIFSFCIDNDCNIASVTNTLNKLIDENIVQKLYYSPGESRFTSEPIGDDSLRVFKLKYPRLTLGDTRY